MEKDGTQQVLGEVVHNLRSVGSSLKRLRILNTNFQDHRRKHVDPLKELEWYTRDLRGDAQWKAKIKKLETMMKKPDAGMKSHEHHKYDGMWQEVVQYRKKRTEQEALEEQQALMRGHHKPGAPSRKSLLAGSASAPILNPHAGELTPRTPLTIFLEELEQPGYGKRPDVHELGSLAHLGPHAPHPWGGAPQHQHSSSWHHHRGEPFLSPAHSVTAKIQYGAHAGGHGGAASSTSVQNQDGIEVFRGHVHHHSQQHAPGTSSHASTHRGQLRRRQFSVSAQQLCAISLPPPVVSTVQLSHSCGSGALLSRPGAGVGHLGGPPGTSSMSSMAPPPRLGYQISSQDSLHRDHHASHVPHATSQLSMQHRESGAAFDGEGGSSFSLSRSMAPGGVIITDHHHGQGRRSTASLSAGSFPPEVQEPAWRLAVTQAERMRAEEQKEQKDEATLTKEREQALFALLRAKGGPTVQRAPAAKGRRHESLRQPRKLVGDEGKTPLRDRNEAMRRKVESTFNILHDPPLGPTRLTPLLQEVWSVGE